MICHMRKSLLLNEGEMQRNRGGDLSNAISEGLKSS